MRVIVLTSYERHALFRFLIIYLGSVFVLLAIIGYLFFENNVSMMKSSMKYEMMYQARKISSQIIMRAMHSPHSDQTRTRYEFLKELNQCRFQVGYYDENRKVIYSELEGFDKFDQSFTINRSSCYSVSEDPSNHLGVHYIVLKESNLSDEMHTLRMKIIGYLILSFIFMGIVGYFLARLFLAPVRNKIESLDRFITDTTHELNTPISAILMTIQTLKGCDEKRIKRLEASAKRLSTMYGSLTYRLQGEHRDEVVESLRLDTIIEERVEYVRGLIDSKRLSVELRLDKMVVDMDRESAVRLIDNLLSNAIKYSDPNGKIEIDVSKNILTIADNGIGIESSAQKDIFKRYKRANKERGGFGIGLDIVLSICRRYNIKIELKSKVDEGSRFSLIFPE